jgi:hypothetical protein
MVLVDTLSRDTILLTALEKNLAKQILTPSKSSKSKAVPVTVNF